MKPNSFDRFVSFLAFAFMHLPRYKILFGEDSLQYRFISDGPNGLIEKIVVFTLWQEPDVYNLGFGNRVAGSADIDDRVVTNNGDTDKVLSTVAAIAGDFMEKNAGTGLIITGSSAGRMRLYRMQIGKHLGWLKRRMMVFGLVNNQWEIFDPHTSCEAYYVTQKSYF